MREIKFRAWDKIWKKMYEIREISFEMTICKGMIMEYDNTGKIKKGIYTLHKFNEIELMQFTGLKDKNGKEIYEGDIIEDSLTKENMFIFWYKDRFGISSTRLFKMHNGIPIDLRFSDFLKHNKTGVIGNKFENPELLN